jgi:thiol-disulfide isomerase/thioredoxin
MYTPSPLSIIHAQLELTGSTVYADWCPPCKAIAPVYEQLSASLSRPNQITFTKVDTDAQPEIASKYSITAYVSFLNIYGKLRWRTRPLTDDATSLPTFVIFKQGKVIEKVGPEPRKLQDIVSKLAAEAEGVSSSSGFGGSSSGGSWRVTEPPKGYDDVTDQLDVKGLDLLNADSEFGGVRVLFDSSKPSALGKGKDAEGQAKDWVESDTDEQLMLFMPFQSTLKVLSIQVSVRALLFNVSYQHVPLSDHLAATHIRRRCTNATKDYSAILQSPTHPWVRGSRRF